MMDYLEVIVTQQALIREWVNGIAMTLFFTLSVMVAIFMWDVFLKTETRKTWVRTPGIVTACALLWVFLSEAYRTGTLWVLYNIGKWQASKGVFFKAESWGTSYAYFFASIALVLGLLRCISVFTPPEWHRRVWAQALFVSFGVCTTPVIGRFLLGVLLNQR